MKKILALSLFLVLFTQPFLADRGMVPPQDVLVFEPGQKGIIGWNGTHEVLILSTDVYASEYTTVLEILPLPSMPEVEEGSFNSFLEIQYLLDARGQLDYGIKSFVIGVEGTNVEVLFHEQIGAHDITVVRAENSEEFINWANGFLLGKGMEYEFSTAEVSNAVSDYISRGIKYFVFDLVEITPYERSVEPIVYSFESDSLYFPLKISSLASGVTSINLFTITYDKIERANFTRLDFDSPTQFEITSYDLERIDSRIADLFHSVTWLTVANYDGPLDSLREDISIRLAPVEPPETPKEVNPLVWVIISFVVGVFLIAFALGAKKVRK